MLSIINFYVSKVLCYHYLGHTGPSGTRGGANYMGGALLAQNLQKGEFLDFEPIFSMVDVNIIIPLNKQGIDFQGGGFSFLRYDFILSYVCLCDSHNKYMNFYKIIISYACLQDFQTLP